MKTLNKIQNMFYQ